MTVYMRLKFNIKFKFILTSQCFSLWNSIMINCHEKCSIQEFMTICKNLTDEQVKAAFKQFDTSGDDKLDYREFCEMINKREREGNWIPLWEALSTWCDFIVFYYILISSFILNQCCVKLLLYVFSLVFDSCPLDCNFVIRIVKKISHSFCIILSNEVKIFIRIHIYILKAFCRIQLINKHIH